MASILKVDELQGIATTGDITVTSEGGAATQSLQQGLAKAWFQAQMYTSNTINDSLNGSSLTDNAAGDFTLTVTNAFGNDKFCITGSTSQSHVLQDRNTRDGAYNNYRTTSTQRCSSMSDAGTRQDCNHNCVSFHGDLA